MNLLKRLPHSLGLLLMVCALTYLMILLVPGDPAVTAAGENATAEQVAQTRERLGLDDPLVVQFVRWLGDAVTGDLGRSLQGGASVSGLLVDRFPVTLGLALVSIVISLVIAVPAAIIAATRKGSAVDRLITLLASAGIAVPTFWLGLMLIIAFSLYLRVLPSTGYVPFSESPTEWLKHIVMPAFTLAAAPAAEIARQLRASLIDILDQDYVRTATAKGLSQRSVVMKHALKNAGVPAMTMVGLQLTFLLGGSVIVEQIFGIPGLGALSITAVLQRDIPVIQGAVLVAAVAVLVVNLMVDSSYRIFNPKVR